MNYSVDNQPKASNWPTSLGVLGIIFGLLGLVTYSASFLITSIQNKHFPEVLTSTSLSPNSQHMELERTEADIKRVVSEFLSLSRIKLYLEGGLALLSLLLFFAGILLMLRYRLAAKLLITWAALKLLVGFVWAFLSQRSYRLFATLGDNNLDFKEGADTFQLVVIAVTILLAVWLALLPIIFLAVLFRKTVKREIAEGYGWK